MAAANTKHTNIQKRKERTVSNVYVGITVPVKRTISFSNLIVS